MNTNIHQKLKELRQKNNYSQTDVAKYLNISRQAISRWETGNATPDLDNLILLSKLYHTPVDEFLNISDEAATQPMSNASEQNSSPASAAEIIGLSVILVLFAEFPLIPVFTSIFIAVWLKKTKRNYLIVYLLCIVCLIIGLYNTYIFYIHLFPNTGTFSVVPV